LPAFLFSYLQIERLWSRISLEYRFPQSTEVDGSVQVPMTRLPGVSDAFEAKVGNAIYESLLMLTCFEYSIVTLVAAFTF